MANRSRLHAFHPEESFKETMEGLQKLIDHPSHERNELMALRAEVQRLVDEVRRNSDLAQASRQADEVRGRQIDDLKSQVSSLRAGQTVDEENLAGINKAIDQLAETNTALGAAVPAGTSADPNASQAPRAAPPGTAQVQTQPPTHDQAGSPINPDGTPMNAPAPNEPPAPATENPPAVTEPNKGGPKAP